MSSIYWILRWDRFNKKKKLFLALIIIFGQQKNILGNLFRNWIHTETTRCTLFVFFFYVRFRCMIDWKRAQFLFVTPILLLFCVCNLTLVFFSQLKLAKNNKTGFLTILFVWSESVARFANIFFCIFFGKQIQYMWK